MAFKGDKWIFKGIPEFENDSAGLRYFETEDKYWDKGRYGLSGEYYKYLTMYKIRDRVKGKEFFADFRMVDNERIFPWIKEVFTNKQDGLFVTQRGGGKSTIFLGYLPLETAIQNPGSKVIMTSEAVNTTATNFSEKLKIGYEGLHPLYRPSLVAEWPDEKAQKQYIKFGKRKRGMQDVGIGSIIESIETAKDEKSPSKLEGQGCFLLVNDEIYKHPYTREVRERGSALVRTGRKKEGVMMSVGSLSDPTAKGLENAIYMIENAATEGINVLFVPASWFNPYIEKLRKDGSIIPNEYHDVTINGNPQFIDIKKAENALKANRKILESLPDKRLFQQECLKYPLTLDELLHVTRESWWTEQEQYEINKHYEKVRVAISHSDYSQCDRPAYVVKNEDKYSLEYQNAKVDTAKFFIFEEPVEGRVYGCGVDTIPFSTSNKEGSDHVALIKCFDTNQYVAGYYDRDDNANLVAKNTILLQIIYNKAQALVEKNSIGALKNAYENFGLIDLLAYAPLKFRPKATTIERGLNKHNNAPVLHQLVRSYLFGDVSNGEIVGGDLHLMFMRRFFKEYIKFPMENADFLDAMAMAEALHTEYRRIQMYRKFQSNQGKQESTVRYQTINGRRQMIVTSESYENNQGELDLLKLFKS